MIHTKRLLALLLAAVMVFALAACSNTGDTPNTGSPAPSDSSNPSNSSGPSGTGSGSAPAERTRIEDGTYRTLYAAEVQTMNYLTSSTTGDLSVGYNVVDCLVEYDSYGKVEPALATSWEPNADATVWTFKIREGVKWVDKDGNPVADVTANDWVSAARYVCDANNGSSTFNTYDGVIAGAAEYFEYTAYLLALKTAEDGVDENGNPCKVSVTRKDDGTEVREVLKEVPEASIEDIGVKALDDYTLEYTLVSSRPYFVSMVSYGPYMPVYGPFLEQCGDKFGTSNEYLLYCGAFILSTFERQSKHIMTRNPHYWEPEAVHLAAVESTYNPEASSISSTMYQSGAVDQATISSDLLSAMLADPKTASSIHPTRSDTSYSYWYLFNFNPNFDAEYEPDNWRIAVNNENFRQSIVHAFNRLPALATSDRNDPESLKNNTITPTGFVSASKDFTTYGDLAAFASGDYFDAELAVQYKQKAIEELTAAGATFPIKVLMTYRVDMANWANECQVVEQQIEGVLGTDYVDLIVQGMPETNFLSEVRRSGKYGFMKCNWGADYADPETYSDPFAPGNSYNFVDKSTDPTTMAVYNEYQSLVNAAKEITTDMEARYEAFAKAEAFYLEHGFAIPFSISSRDYQMSKLNVFEGQYASFGGANQRYKDQYLYSSSMSIEEFSAAYAQWAAEVLAQ